MAARKDCFDKVAEAAGISRQEAEEVLSQTDDVIEGLKSKGINDRVRQRVEKAMERKAEKTRLAAAMQRRHAALNVMKRNELDNQIDGYIAAGLSPSKAISTVFEGAARRIPGARVSVNARQQAYEKTYLAPIFQKIEQERPHLKKMLEDPQLDANIMREMFELREGGTPGRTGDSDAKFLADIFAEQAELTRQDLNNLGANIGRLDGWTGPQTHDPAKLIKVSAEDWVASITPRLDLDRMFTESETPEEINAVLSDIYNTLITGRGAQDTAAARGDFTAPANLAKSLGASRVLHFRDVENALAYRKDFGYGTTASGIFGHMQLAARQAGVMDTFGPNPEVMLKAVLERRQQNIRNSSLPAKEKKKRIDSLEFENFQTRYSVAVGNINNTAPGGGFWADIYATMRTVMAMAKLGGATITALPTDTASMAYASMLRGDGFFRGLADHMGYIFRGRGSKEQREIAAALGEGFEGISGAVTRGMGALDGPVGYMSWAATKFFKYNGLTGWTDIARSAASRVISHSAGRVHNVKFGNLNENFRNVLELNGIDAKRWDRIRASAFKAENGKMYITPDRIENRDDAMAWRRYVWDETTYGVVEMDAAGRRLSMVNQDARPGTFAGEAIRFIMQFKGFPISFTNRVLGRALLGGKGETGWNRALNAVPNIGVLLGSMTVAGYMSQVMKDVLRGHWPPRDPKDPKVIMDAAARGGALGFYSDFLFADSSNTRGGMLPSMAGPGFSTLAEMEQALSRAKTGEGRPADLLNLAINNTPGLNLFYLRPALDYLFINSLREAASPGYMRRRRRYRKKDYGQETFFGETAF